MTLLDLPTTKEKGFRLLMNTYQERVYWHVRRMTHIHEDADDVMQNTFIKVFKNIDKYKGESKLYTWIYRIATNECITFLNKKKKRQHQQYESEIDMLSQLKADPYWDGDEAQLMLQMAIETLPEKQKAVFCLKYYDNLKYKEISEILETSEGALKASYHHAVKKIEDYVKAHAS